MTPWIVPLTAVASAGNLTQCYVDTNTPGSGATTSGTEVRKPTEGVLFRAEVATDGTNGGVIEVWDLNGADGGADVNTATVITDAQRAAAVTLGKARLIWTQNFTGSSGARMAITRAVPFMHGLAARYINGAGTCTLNLLVDGGGLKTTISG